MFEEGELVEFKREFTHKMLKTVVAFANSRGGVIYLGVDDDGTLCGLEDADKAMLAAVNSIRDGIRPSAAAVTQCETIQLEGKSLVGIRVERGAKRPYYLADKGMRPEGVYVRQGSASFMATEAEIAAMLQAAAGSYYEDGRSLRQDLTFAATATAFEAHGLDWGEAQMASLGLVDGDSQFTNLGLLLSDQCEASIKLAAFFGSKRTTFKDRAETSGSLLAQVDQAMTFLERHAHYKTRFEGLRRIDYDDFPPDALREALLNAVVHRDYALAAPTLASVLEDRIELTSHGGLPRGCALEEFQMDVSVPRNPKLAAVFYRLGLIESYGTGITRMFEAYEGSGRAPEFEITRHLFKVTLPNRNAELRATPRRPHAADADAMGDRERVVLTMLEEEGPLKRADIQKRFEFSQATLLRILKKLEEQGLVQPEGQTRNRTYRAVAV